MDVNPAAETTATARRIQAMPRPTQSRESHNRPGRSDW
jgi:hypothetical protein